MAHYKRKKSKRQTQVSRDYIIKVGNGRVHMTDKDHARMREARQEIRNAKCST